MRVYFSTITVNIAPRHNLQTGLTFRACFAVYFTLLLLFCCIEGISAQNLYKITGKVIDKDSTAVEFASVVLSNNFTKKLTGTTTGVDGTFVINAKEGGYTFEVSLLGYEKYTLKLTVDNDINVGDIVLKDEINTLKEAKIVANRVSYNMEGYEYKVGNIEALKNKDLTDILRTAPGLMVTNKITLYGNAIGNVYVDRRRVKMTEETLLAYLRSYKGGNIEKIEVISDPDISARHEGTAIKITTKKQEGGFLSASARVLYNENNFVVGPDFNLNYRKGKFSFYTSGGYTNQNRDTKEITSYDWKNADKRIDDITTEKIKLPLSINGTFGIGYDISKNDYLSAEVSFRERERDQKRMTFVESIGADADVASEGSYRDYNTVTRTPTVSLMYVHTFKDASEFTVTGDYVGSYKKDDIVSGVLKDNDLKEDDKLTHTENNTSTFAGYANYSKRIKKKHNINAGMRYSYIMNEAINNESTFAYNEGLLKPFASYSVNFKKFGLRTGITGNWANIDHNNYIDILPSASVNYYMNRNKGHILSAGYYMGVGRPSISSLNPNAVLSDQDIIVRVGNPNLESYYIHNFSTSLKLFNSYTLSADYDIANDAITSYLETDDKGTIYQKYTNDANSKSVTIQMTANKYLFNRLNLDFMVAYAYSESEANGTVQRNNTVHCALVAYLMLPKSFSFTAMSFANSKKRIGHNAYKKEPFVLDLSLSKRIKRWNIKFSVGDVFDSYKGGSNTTIDMGDYTQKVTSYTASRSYSINVMYNFSWGKAGRIKKTDSQKRDMGSRIGY